MMEKYEICVDIRRVDWVEPPPPFTSFGAFSLLFIGGNPTFAIIIAAALFAVVRENFRTIGGFVGNMFSERRPSNETRQA